jgi:hypothetical protein
MCPFAQSMRQAQILLLAILNVFLWLKFSPSLTLNKIERFEAASKYLRIQLKPCRHGGSFVHYF